MSSIIRMYKLYYIHTKHGWKRSELQSYGLMISSFRILVTLSDAWKTKAPNLCLTHTSETNQCQLCGGHRETSEHEQAKQGDRNDCLFHIIKTTICIWTR